MTRTFLFFGLDKNELTRKNMTKPYTLLCVRVRCILCWFLLYQCVYYYVIVSLCVCLCIKAHSTQHKILYGPTIGLTSLCSFFQRQIYAGRRVKTVQHNTNATRVKKNYSILLRERSFQFYAAYMNI